MAIILATQVEADPRGPPLIISGWTRAYLSGGNGRCRIPRSSRDRSRSC